MIKHSKAAAAHLQDRERADWQDETLWQVRSKRDLRASEVPGWEALRDRAAAIKDYCADHVEDLIDTFERRAAANGAVVHRAADAAEYCRIIGDLLCLHGVRKFVKSKSMLSEECGLQPYLAGRGIEVIETDLGERIIQLLHQKPSHIVLPAIHLRREQVGELFEREMGTEPGNSDPTYLTHAARANLRGHFLTADAAMTGANFAVASTGDVVVCTNEGNADMGTSIPKLQIAAFGLEKIVPDLESLGVFSRLLARSATGQAVTTYTTHYRAPREEGCEFHIIVVDNGRREILANPVHRGVLRCLRCGACMNTCPVYRRSGGYSYPYFIPGPIGVNLGMLRSPKEFRTALSACSLCHSCSMVCPAKVDLAEQIYAWRQEYCSSAAKHAVSDALKVVMSSPALFNSAMSCGALGLRLAPWVKWGQGRAMPQFPPYNFNSLMKK